MTNNEKKVKAVIKSKEFGSNKGGFFSGLGFEKKEEKKKEKVEDTTQDDLLVHAATKSHKKDTESVSFSGENARVIRKAAPSPTRNTRPTGSRPTFSRGNRSTTNRGSGARNNSQNKERSFTRNSYQKKPATTPSPKVEKKAPPKPKKVATTSSTLTKKESILIGDNITVKEFSEKMGVTLQDVLKVMLQNKIMGGVNTVLDFDTASLIALEFGVAAKGEEQSVDLDKILTGDLQAILDNDKNADNLLERPPVVTVMGHVDHGKTSLLDYLRKSNVTGGEAGGITQSIGASSITHDGKQITFIDTPGHELFTALRARGAKLTNIAIIIIAADDGIKPQTIESINHAKDAGVPIIVAVTKIDKPNNNYEKIKTDIGQHGLIPEEWGGDIPVIGVSSVTGQGIPDLLDHILLQSEVLELQYNPDRKAVGVVVDAHKDPRQGISTSLIVLTGTLKVGDVIVVHNTYGKVKRMLDYKGKPMKKAVGGDPVMILGLNEIPEPGRVVEGVKNEKEAKEKVEIIKEQMADEKQQSTMQHFLQQMKEEGNAELKLILKSDGPSSLEALSAAVEGITVPSTVSIKVVHKDVGDPSDSDIALAQAADAVIIGFNTKTNASMKKKAEQHKVSIKSYDIIYEIIEFIEQAVYGLVEVEIVEEAIGKLEVLANFFRKERMMVIGGKVVQGKTMNGALFRIFRGEEEIGKGEITSLQKEQENVKEIGEGHECGMKVTSKKRIEEGDTLEFYVLKEVKPE